MSTTTVAALYDALPYLGVERSELDPAHLGAIAQLRGLAVPAMQNLRVVEIGCGDGAQLCSFARRFPSAKLQGIDISQQHIARAQASCKQDGLEIDFVCSDFSQIKSSGVDLIIAHGIYSYLDNSYTGRSPRGESKAVNLLKWCRAALAPHGICCISFNTLPGWHMRSLFGDIAACGDNSEQLPGQRVARARELLSLAERSVREDPRPEGDLLRTGLAQILASSDHYVFHEFLATRAQPLLVSEFSELARACDLNLFADANYSRTYADPLCGGQLNLPLSFAERFNQLSPIERFQIGDFVANSSFRAALLVRADAQINQTLSIDGGQRLAVQSSLRSISAQRDYSKNIFEEFITSTGRTFACEDVSLRAALHILEQSPDDWTPIAQLTESTSQLIGKQAKFDLLALFATNLLDLRLHDAS